MKRWNRRQFVAKSTAAAAGAALLSRYPSALFAVQPGSDTGVAFLKPTSDGYARSATVFNKRIKTQPALIAACTSEAGVAKAVRYAIDHDLRIAVKSGGHCFEGECLNSDGLVIDVALMNQQTLNGQTYTAGPGVKLAQAYEFLLPKGRLLPAGSCGTVGLSGLTLGGGYGLFARRYGLTCDHLTNVRMIDGNGDLRDSADDPALLWSCRGGGNGNFGIVTQMRFTTRPAPTHLPRHRLKFHGLDANRAAELCERWFTQAQRLPDDAFSAFVLNGSTLTVLITSFDPQSKAKVKAVADAIAVGASTVAKHANEPIARAVTRYYGAKNPLHFKNASAGYYKGFADLTPGIEDVFQSVIAGSGLLFQINTLGGTIADPALQKTAAYPHRAYPFLGELQCYWDNDRQTQGRVASVNAIQKQLRDMGIDKHYRNYPSTEIENPSIAYYGKTHHEYLQRCKQAYDPSDRIGGAQRVRV